MPPEGGFRNRRSRIGTEGMPLLNPTRDAPSEAGMVDLDARPRESAIVNAVDDFDACDREIVTSIGPANAAHHIFGIIRLGLGREDNEA